MRLYMKVNILEQYLTAVESGELPVNHDLLRQVKLIVQKLPKAPESQLNSISVGEFPFFLQNLKNISIPRTVLMTYIDLRIEFKTKL